ncbi:MAG: GGDEF domain-containing protein [Thermoleophilia bacterium]|nr:GGDEF domain-containing protein [Thermoleophilia bacterium]
MDKEGDLYRTIVDKVSDGVYFCDGNRRISYWSRGAERITGYPAEGMMGVSCGDGFLMHVDERGTSLCKDDCPLVKTMADGQERETQAYLHHSAGHRVPVYLHTFPIHGPDGKVAGVVEAFTDNSMLLAALRRVDELSVEAETDALTGIRNRRGIEIKLDSCMAECREIDVSGGVLFADIDFFKEVNDTYGHDAGDRVLRMVANTLKHNLRDTDVVGRWGGEEFLALLKHIDETGLAATAEKLRTLVASSFLNIEGAEVRVTISIGATLLRPEDTAQTIVARADRLLYESKSAGRNRVTLEV